MPAARALRLLQPDYGDLTLPLPTLLSQTLVAFTIEFDNEFERLMPHRTKLSVSRTGSRTGPWLVSLAMWSNLMRLVSEDGVTVRDLQRSARVAKLSLSGMERWGYITVEPDPGSGHPKPPRLDWVVRRTAKGRDAQEVWRPLFDVIEKRWKARFGTREFDELRDSLGTLIARLDVELPEYLPVLGYGLVAEVHHRTASDPSPPGVDDVSHLHLPALLSKALLAFAIDFESESELSLAIGANVLRLFGENGLRVRDIPRLAGVSKEAIAMAVGFLVRRGFATIEPDPVERRTRSVRLTLKGKKAQVDYRRRLVSVEERWRKRFGRDLIGAVRAPLERMVGVPTAQSSPLFRGLTPHPDGWRASVAMPDTLPHYPMVLHRGGFPDGA